MDEKILPTVQLGGRLWQVRIGHKVLQKFSALTRVGMEQMGAVINRYDMMILLLWCILSEQDPTLKRETLDNWLDELPIREWQKLLRQIGESIAASFPDEEDEEDGTAAGTAGAGEENPTGAAT